MHDPSLDEIIAKYPRLSLKRTEGEYRVFKSAEENKGSLWIANQRAGFRIVTTGTAHIIDPELQKLTGKRGLEYSDRYHKTWKSLTAGTVDNVLKAFDAL
jgi:hypothetical protein